MILQHSQAKHVEMTAPWWTFCLGTSPLRPAGGWTAHRGPGRPPGGWDMVTTVPGMAKEKSLIEVNEIKDLR